MTNEEIEKLIQHTKAEFLNEQIVKESDLETTQEQSYAKGWNDCNSRWIKTLRAELDENEDVISREAVLQEIDKYIEKTQSTGTKDDFISFEELVIKQLPSVAPSYNSIKTELKPCEDCISREAVVNWLEVCTDDSIEHAIESNLEFIPPVTPQPFIKKPCISEGVCREDKMQVLDKIKEEIRDNTYFINEITEKEGIDFETVEKIIDKYKAESEDEG